MICSYGPGELGKHNARHVKDYLGGFYLRLFFLPGSVTPQLIKSLQDCINNEFLSKHHLLLLPFSINLDHKSFDTSFSPVACCYIYKHDKYLTAYQSNKHLIFIQAIVLISLDMTARSVPKPFKSS